MKSMIRKITAAAMAFAILGTGTAVTNIAAPQIAARTTLTASALEYHYTTVNKGGVSRNTITGKTTLISYSSWKLVADASGEFYMENGGTRKFFKQRNNNNRITEFHCPYDKNSAYPGSAQKIMINDTTMRYSIFLQDDGNLVAYSYGNTNRPLWHTNTYEGSPTRKDFSLCSRYRNEITGYKYELASNGTFIIYAKYRTFGYREIWNSNSNYIFRVV
ncbi:MAG: hypothetical protein J6Y64_02935 [Ruminococcus sp.]|nr:hypothetical protein [Ruminococcus sp.]